MFRDGSVPGRCPGFVTCWPSQGFPDEMKNICSGQDACCIVVLTLCGLDRPSCGALSPVGWDRDRFWVLFLLGSTPAQGLPPVFHVPGFYSWAALAVNALG